jgi:hypothetical protein
MHKDLQNNANRLGRAHETHHTKPNFAKALQLPTHGKQHSPQPRILKTVFSKLSSLIFLTSSLAKQTCAAGIGFQY